MDDREQLFDAIKGNFDKRLTAVEQRLATQDQLGLTNSEHIIALQKAVSDIASDTKLNQAEIKHMNLSVSKLESAVQQSATKVESTVSEIWRTLSAVKDGIAPAIKEAISPMQTTIENLNSYRNQQIGSLKVWIMIGTVAATAVSSVIVKLMT